VPHPLNLGDTTTLRTRNIVGLPVSAAETGIHLPVWLWDAEEEVQSGGEFAVGLFGRCLFRIVASD